MENLKNAYNKYVKYLQKHKEIDMINNAVYPQLHEELKLKNRLKFSAFFWISSYFIICRYIANNLGMTRIGKVIWFSANILPNFYFYNHKFKKYNNSLHEILLTDNIKRSVKVTSQQESEFLKEFINYYIGFCNKNLKF